MSNNPIEKAKALTPWWMMEIRRFDGLEIHPCHVCDVEDGIEHVEQCTPDEAEFWSVYGHGIEGGVWCLEDFPGEGEARAFAETLLKAYPHLNQYGLWG